MTRQAAIFLQQFDQLQFVVFIRKMDAWNFWNQIMTVNDISQFVYPLFLLYFETML